MLEKIIAGFLIGTSLSFGSCTKEESISKNQQETTQKRYSEDYMLQPDKETISKDKIVEITRETPSPKLKQKVSELKELYKEKEYFQARELAKKIIMTDKTNLETNIIFLHINWIIRNHTGEIGELNPNSQYHDMKIFERLTYKTEDPTFLLEEILKEPNLRIPVGENMFGKVSDWSTIHDEVKHILNSLYITSEEANKKNISIISRIKDSPSAWLGHCKTWEDEDGFIHNKKDITIEGTVIDFGDLDVIGEYFILKDRFNQEIKVCYENKPKLGEHIMVDVERIFTRNEEPVLIPKKDINEPANKEAKELQDLTNKFDLSTPEKTLEQLIKVVSTKDYSKQELKYFLTKSTLKTLKTDEDYQRFIKEQEIDCLESLKDYNIMETYNISEKIKVFLLNGTVNEENKQQEVYLYALFISESNKWRLHEGIGVGKKEELLSRKEQEIPSLSINSYIELKIRMGLYEVFYGPRDYSSEKPSDLVRKERDNIFQKEDGRKNLNICKDIIGQAEENVIEQLSPGFSNLGPKKTREKLKELEKVREYKKMIDNTYIK